MKTLIALLLTLIAFTFVSHAQTTTNLQIKVTSTVTVAGVSTNANNATLTLDPANKNDALRIQGWTFAWQAYTNSIGTNAPVAFEAYVKQQIKVVSDNYAAQVQAANNAAILAGLTKLLTLQSDTLSAGQLSTLASISALAQ